MKSLIEHLADQLRRAYSGEAWHGPALTEILNGVSPAQAAGRPIRGAHSIWELALHIAAWSNVCRLRIEGIELEEPQEGDFPPVPEPTEESWSAALQVLKESNNRLAAVVTELDEARLSAKATGKPYSIAFSLFGDLQHIAYHGGQIAILKKALGRG